jgi:2-(1,2-epoxy-1,2-dihydrophenyl)acetyl-CoA isomerase
MLKMDEILEDEPRPHVRRLLINRPSARNAINEPVRNQLLDALLMARDDPHIRCVLIGGSGGLFSAGGDLPSLVGLSAGDARARMQSGHQLVRLLWAFPKPVISAVERLAAGAAAGLALLADRIVIGQNANLLFPFLRLGLVPDWGLMQTLTRRAGYARANQILLDNASIKGTDAIGMGLADIVSAETEVMARALMEAEALAALPLSAFNRLKAGLRNAEQSDPLFLVHEAEMQVACITGAEFEEGYAAFKEKRAASFTGLGSGPGG